MKMSDVLVLINDEVEVAKILKNIKFKKSISVVEKLNLIKNIEQVSLEENNSYFTSNLILKRLFFDRSFLLIYSDMDLSEDIHLQLDEVEEFTRSKLFNDLVGVDGLLYYEYKTLSEHYNNSVDNLLLQKNQITGFIIGEIGKISNSLNEFILTLNSKATKKKLNNVIKKLEQLDLNKLINRLFDLYTGNKK